MLNIRLLTSWGRHLLLCTFQLEGMLFSLEFSKEKEKMMITYEGSVCHYASSYSNTAGDRQTHYTGTLPSRGGGGMCRRRRGYVSRGKGVCAEGGTGVCAKGEGVCVEGDGGMLHEAQTILNCKMMMMIMNHEELFF